MEFSFSATSAGIVFVLFSLIALGAYLRILVILRFLDAGLENPPQRPHLSDKLRSYRDFCRDRQRKPVLLMVFAIGVAGAFLAWLPLPWLVFRIP
ncbi:MAG TPA: hypothetical protein PLV45_15625 [bacterium]|nr:hypothetical protein [bacterium]